MLSWSVATVHAAFPETAWRAVAFIVVAATLHAVC